VRVLRGLPFLHVELRGSRRTCCYAYSTRQTLVLLHCPPKHSLNGRPLPVFERLGWMVSVSMLNRETCRRTRTRYPVNRNPLPSFQAVPAQKLPKTLPGSGVLIPPRTRGASALMGNAENPIPMRAGCECVSAQNRDHPGIARQSTRVGANGRGSPVAFA